MGEPENRETAKSWATSAGTAAVTGAGGGTVFGIVGALLYDNASDAKLSCTGILNRKYDGSTYHSVIGTPIGCSKVVDLPVFGTASSLVDAAATYGVVIAVLVFIVSLLYLGISRS
jgi:hypothetical protein